MPIDDVLVEVQRADSLEGSVEALFTQLQSALVAAGLDQTKVATVLAQFRSVNDKMAAAIVANTPAAPAA